MSRVRRSALFAPADDPDMMANAVSSDADAVIFDLEDAVPRTRLARARATLGTAIDDAGDVEIGVRINGLGTDLWLDDLEAAIAADLEAVLVPKVESADSVSVIAEAVCVLADDPPTVRLAIESPVGLLAGREIVSRASSRAPVTGLSFGLADYCRAIGAPEIPDSVREHVSFQVRTLAAAGGLDPFASTYLDPHDEEGLRAVARSYRSVGYVGMAAIHPEQVSVINEVFTPDPERVGRARRLIDAYEDAESDSLLVEGAFLDEAIVERYRGLVERYEAIRAHEDG